jgi:hypothetical protein
MNTTSTDQLHSTGCFWIIQLIKKFPAFVEPEASLFCTQEPVTGTYPEPVKSTE